MKETRILTFGETKNSKELLEMLSDLRRMGSAVELWSANEHFGRVVSFRPFASAVISNISAFFANQSLAEVASLYTASNEWFEDKHLTFIDFKAEITKNAKKNIRLSKKHPEGLKFAANHLLNVIKLWPLSNVSCTEKKLLENAKKKIAVQQRRCLLKKNQCFA